MKVILLKDVKGTGRKDQVLDISEGFARNFLLPRRLAVLASGQALSALEKEHWRKSQKETAEIKKADVLLGRLASQPLKFVLPADQKGHRSPVFDRRGVLEKKPGDGEALRFLHFPGPFFRRWRDRLVLCLSEGLETF